MKDYAEGVKEELIILEAIIQEEELRDYLEEITEKQEEAELFLEKLAALRKEFLPLI